MCRPWNLIIKHAIPFLNVPVLIHTNQSVELQCVQNQSDAYNKTVMHLSYLVHPTRDIQQKYFLLT